MHVEFLTHLEMRNLTAEYTFISSQHDLFGFIGRKNMTSKHLKGRLEPPVGKVTNLLGFPTPTLSLNVSYAAPGPC